MNKDEWRSSWECFITDLQSHLSASEDTEEISRPYSGFSITWTGVLAKVDLDDIAPSVDIDLPAIAIQVGEDRECVLNGIHLPIAANSKSKWNKLQTGDQVKFSATFASGTPFSAIQVKHLKSGKSVIFIRLQNGMPLTAK